MAEELKPIEFNRESDFKLKITLNGGGASTSVPFRLSFYTTNSKKSYVAEYVNGEAKNCVIVNDKVVLAVFDSHNLGTGTLLVREEYFLTDEDFNDGICNTVSRGFVTTPNGERIKLTDGISENMPTEIDAELFPFYQKGDQGDPFLYEDFTPEQLEEHKRPAVEAAKELKEEFNKIKEGLTKDYNDKISKIESEYKENKESLEKLYSEKTDALKKDYDTKLESLQTSFNNTKKDLSKEVETTKASLKSAYDTTTSNLSKDYTAIKNKLDGEYTLIKQNLQKEYETKKAALERDYTASKVALGLEYGKVIEDLEARYTKWHNDLAADYAQKQQALQDASDAAIEATNEATRNANTATTNANNAASRANASATNANEKASLVQDNITLNTQIANDAKQESAEAKSSAEDAVFKAQGAVGTANSAAQLAQQAKAIAEGKANSKVFATKAEMDAWLAIADNKATLKVGDNLYILATDSPDYWWDGESAQILETEHPDLTDYVKNTDYATADKGGVVKVNGAYGIYINANGIITTNAANEQILLAKTNATYPIVPKYLDYAVKVGITTNTIELTPLEKAAAQRWFGITPITASEYEALADKSGINYVIPD